MATFKFGTVQGKSTKARTPYYIGLVQHESSMPKKETYAHLAETLKFSEANIKAAFLGLSKVLKSNANKGNDAIIDDVTRIKTYAKGSFAGSTGPWVKGVNSLVVNSLEADAFKNALAGIIPENITEGFTPSISSVLDTVTGEYDVISGTNLISTTGVNFGIDTTKSDEYIGVLFDDGELFKMDIVSSSLTLVTSKFATAPNRTGKAKLVIATRCGLGTEFGVKLATRVIELQ